MYYKPHDPSSAVLEQAADRSRVYLFGGIGALFILIALAIAGVRVRRA